MTTHEPTTRLFKNAEWNTCYTHFIQSFSTLTTRHHYGSTLRRFFAFVKRTSGTEKTPDKITRQEIEEFLHAPSQGTYSKGGATSPYTKNAYYIALRSFYNWCATYLVEFRGKQRPILHGKNPMEGLKMVKVGRVDRNMEEEEIDAFFAAIDKTTLSGTRDYAVFKTLLLTGRRLSEITKLRRGDLEKMPLMERSGLIRQGWVYHFKGKGHLTKDDYAEIPAPAVDAIIEYHTKAGRDFLSLPSDFPLFPGGPQAKVKGQALGSDHMDARFRFYRTKANLPNNLCVHSLRREYAWQRYQSNGFDVLDVQRALRHRSILTTMIYVEDRKRKGEGDPIGTILAKKFGHL